ncbi:MAG: glycosyltransferase [bacterium]|nr:glycosyltransferase [bacterium]
MNDAPHLPTFGVLIPNWNGEAFIERCLGSVQAALRRAGRAGPGGGPVEIVVTDDASADRSADLIAAGFPAVRLLRWRRNVGFGRAVNRGMRAMTADWVFLLNNDLALQVDFCRRLIATLDEVRAAGNAPRLFAIGAQTRDWESQSPNHAGQRAAWRGGLIRQEPFEAEAAAPTDFFQAGACLIDRRKFLALGGFAALYHPGYWEDYDLAWQAIRRGWISLYEPRAVAYHWGKGSMRRLLGDWGLSLVIRRNHLLFTWANLADRGLLARHLMGLGSLILRDPPRPGEAGWDRALWAALARLPRVLRLRRRRGGQPATVADRRILRLD